MALTDTQRESIRKRFHSLAETEQNYTKADLNAAIDACETRYQADKSTWASDIETAASGEFDATEKKRIVAAYFHLRFHEDFV